MEDKKQTPSGDGANIQGDVHTGGGDFVGRDKHVIGGLGSLVIGGNVNDSNIVFVETVNKRLGVTPAITVDLLHEETKNGNCAKEMLDGLF